LSLEVARRLMAGLIVVGLAIGVWVLWPRGDPDILPTTTLPLAVITTTSLATTTTATLATTTSDSHVVTTVEEAEEILRELWFGWFEGIYHQDEERIREVVGSQEAVDAALAQFGLMTFSSIPTRADLKLSGTEILRADSTCIAAWSVLDVSAFRPDATGSQGVYILRSNADKWFLVSVWSLREDLWDQDCKAVFELS
jgi:hypothetical protein